MFNNILFQLLCFYLFILTAAQKWDNQYLGCFSEENVISLGDESRTLTPASPYSCAEFCFAKKYVFFILKNDVCYCSKNYMSDLTRQLDADCTIKCSGDNSSSCGGAPNFVSSYITDKSKSKNFLGNGGYPLPIYLGCYSETENDQENRLLKGPVKSLDKNTLQKCSEMCFNLGYLYFGLTNKRVLRSLNMESAMVSKRQNKIDNMDIFEKHINNNVQTVNINKTNDVFRIECRCGNQKPFKSSKIDDKNCNSPCSGNSKHFCGGQWKMGIYSTGITDHVPRRYVGCFENDKKKISGKYLSYQMGNNNSPKRCMNLCNTQRFRYAAVMGKVCECKNYEPDFSLKRSHTKCITECEENPSEYCGGGNTLQNVYKTLFSNPLGKMAVNHVGCYKNVKQHPILNGWEVTIDNLTPKQCVYSCFARRFLYAVLISSNECLCTFIKPHKDAITDKSMCSTPCPGSPKEKCGGTNAMNVYSTGINWRTEAFGNYYKGCIEDNRYRRVYNSYFRNFTMNTPEFCTNHCYKLGYTYAGVSNHSECYCGTREPNYISAPKLKDEQCNTKCSGDANQFCGGLKKMSVFSTGFEEFEYSESLLQCAEPQENTLSDLAFYFPRNNRPALCFRLCKDYRYAFAGVMGASCFCGGRIPDNKHRRNETECNKYCVGSWNDLCGGEDRIHVYKVKKPSSNNTQHHEDLYTLNLRSLWSHDIYIPQEPDYEFVFYNNSKENAFMKNGELVIKPTILSDDELVTKGSLILKGCTNYDNFFIYCAKNASSFDILPPIKSAKLTTRDKFLFRLGKLEIVAKLPKGDWIVSEIAVVCKANEEIKFIIATSYESIDNLKRDAVATDNSNDKNSTILKYGLKIDEHYHLKSIMKQSNFSNQWYDDYHSFVLSWTADKVVFEIDGQSSNLDTVNDLPLNIILDSEFYISIGVSAGGITHFHDNSLLSSGHSKPWRNDDPKAMFNFWNHKNDWAPTWDEEKSALRIQSIKFTTDQNINTYEKN